MALFSFGNTDSDCLRGVIARRWARNAVVAVVTGTLVLSSLVVPVRSEIASASPLNQSKTASASSENSSGNTTSGNSNTNVSEEGGNTVSNTSVVTPTTPESGEDGEGAIDSSGKDQGKDDGSEKDETSETDKADKADKADGTDKADKDASGKDLSDPETATPNEEFGEPTTDVVIEGSINGSLLAKIALAEPDGVPEGGQANKYNYGSGEPWCAYFVMYCARALGLSTSVIPNYPGCPALVSYYKSLNRWQDFTTKYTPHVGDLIFYSTSPGGVASHIGIVVAATETTVTTREGNTSGGAVATHVFNTTNESGLIGNDYYILGYAAPDYPDPSSLEHTNNVSAVLNVSDTAHLVVYDKCICGYEKASDLVSHNFKASEGDSIKLSESEEWVCIDCGATQKNYATGILASSQQIELYDANGVDIAKELSGGSSIAVVDVYLADDGNYWGITADGYKVKMASAGVKQHTQFSEVDSIDETRANAVEQTVKQNVEQTVGASEEQTGSIAHYDEIELGSFDSYVIGSAEEDTVSATCAQVAEVKAGEFYAVSIGAVESTSLFRDAKNKLGTPMLKLVDSEGESLDVEAFKVYGTSSFKLDYTSAPQTIVISPERDCTLVLASQWGRLGTCNDVKFTDVEVYRLN